jgi:hypothetical protein
MKDKQTTEIDGTSNGLSINGIPITVGMRIVDLAGPGEPFVGVVIGTASNGVAYRIVENEDGMELGDISIAEWSMVAICPAPRTPPAEQPPRLTDPAWEAVKVLFANDPLIYPHLLNIEKLAGTAPPKLWFACALGWMSDSAHDTHYIQQKMIDLIADAAGQECKLSY